MGKYITKIFFMPCMKGVLGVLQEVSVGVQGVSGTFLGVSEGLRPVLGGLIGLQEVS